MRLTPVFSSIYILMNLHLIFEDSDKCPLCGEEVDKSVNEDVNAEPVFNLND